jgi:hypothetical protein
VALGTVQTVLISRGSSMLPRTRSAAGVDPEDGVRR